MKARICYVLCPKSNIDGPLSKETISKISHHPKCLIEGVRVDQIGRRHHLAYNKKYLPPFWCTIIITYITSQTEHIHDGLTSFALP
jgi:hypothetical protein